jgi:hypothetical protein
MKWFLRVLAAAMIIWSFCGSTGGPLGRGVDVNNGYFDALSARELRAGEILETCTPNISVSVANFCNFSPGITCPNPCQDSECDNGNACSNRIAVTFDSLAGNPQTVKSTNCNLAGSKIRVYNCRPTSLCPCDQNSLFGNIPCPLAPAGFLDFCG